MLPQSLWGHVLQFLPFLFRHAPSWSGPSWESPELFASFLRYAGDVKPLMDQLMDHLKYVIAYKSCHCKVGRKNRWWTAWIRSLLPRVKSQRFSNLIGIRLDCIWLPTCLQNISQLISSSQATRCWLANTLYFCQICVIIVCFLLCWKICCW